MHNIVIIHIKKRPTGRFDMNSLICFGMIRGGIVIRNPPQAVSLMTNPRELTSVYETYLVVLINTIPTALSSAATEGNHRIQANSGFRVSCPEYCHETGSRHGNVRRSPVPLHIPLPSL